MTHVIRRVPVDWQHPVDDEGDYIPLFGASFAKVQAALARLKVNHPEEDWDALYSDLSPWGCFPEWLSTDITLGYRLYEISSEGTPISPAFATLEELTEWVRLSFKGTPISTEDAREWVEAFQANTDPFVSLEAPHG
jgi:hypothetical protein